MYRILGPLIALHISEHREISMSDDRLPAEGKRGRPEIQESRGVGIVVPCAGPSYIYATCFA
jgi:hypothetical protein